MDDSPIGYLTCNASNAEEVHEIALHRAKELYELFHNEICWNANSTPITLDGSFDGTKVETW